MKYAALKMAFIAFALYSCNSRPVISDVRYEPGKLTDSVMTADLQDAVVRGIEIPTTRQAAGGYFKISFRADGKNSEKYFYKIYYQNERYKFPEIRDTTGRYSPLAEENFYGSWEDTLSGFKPIAEINQIIKDSIKIIGNPRNEKKYFGEPFENSFYSAGDIIRQADVIKNNKEWYAHVVEKAKKNSMNIKDQLLLDAKWVLKNTTGDKIANNRWKRNPRMGTYSLMIVVTTEKDLANIPKHIQYIHRRADSGLFISPYYFFGNKQFLDSLLPSTAVFIDSSFIKVRASLDLASGIYANALEYPAADTPSSSGNCAWNKALYLHAHFSQFFSSLIKDFHLNSIPVIKDVNDSSYTLKEYEKAIAAFPEKLLKKDYIRNTDAPCAYVRYNNQKQAIEIINPGNSALSTAHKTNMGIKTRIGFTYGKITGKIKFPELINRFNVWNGLTNAFWLLFQDERDWNQRRLCKTGYTPKGDNRNDAPRSPVTHYSEIDFEMIKTSPYWPAPYYKGRRDSTEDHSKNTDDVIIGCTNWDLTCQDCRKYTVGIDTVIFGRKSFETLRWDKGYQALTTRTAAKDDELFKRPYYYYQFEWTPVSITWRVGPEKDKLYTVGYMNDGITSIPNNQMIAVITQEYHLSEWWPPIPFRQEYIPFPKTDIKGAVYEITIE